LINDLKTNNVRFLIKNQSPYLTKSYHNRRVSQIYLVLLLLLLVEVNLSK